MTQATTTTRFRTVAELIRRLGDIPLERVRLAPPPGTATEADVLEVERREGRLCELVDGVLVEKPMGYHESRQAVQLLVRLQLFLNQHDLGAVAGADGMLRLTTGLMRIPDVSFVSWDRLPGRVLPPDPIPDLPIDLAVEVLNRGNTKKEMRRKLAEYRDAGVRLVWFLDFKRRTAWVFTPDGRPAKLGEADTLDGGAVLPGFALPLRELFDAAAKGMAGE